MLALILISSANGVVCLLLFAFLGIGVMMVYLSAVFWVLIIGPLLYPSGIWPGYRNVGARKLNMASIIRRLLFGILFTLLAVVVTIQANVSFKTILAAFSNST